MLLMSAQPVIQAHERDLALRIVKIRASLGRAPGLAVVIVGDDPASHIYVRKKGEIAERLGIAHWTHAFPDSANPAEVLARIEALNADPAVDGILLQRPLPPQFVESDTLEWVSPAKDVDAFHPYTVGRTQLGLSGFKSCTPLGVMKLLDHYAIPLEGKRVCVIGRSNIVGKPMAALLLARDATVTQAHSRTRDLESLTLSCDIIVAAAGKPKLLGAKHVRPGTVVVDVGIHRDAAGKVSGDVDFEAVKGLVSAITPVPGGVGPMTIAMLMENTVCSAETKAGIASRKPA